MKADNRSLKDWFSAIADGRVRLPRFQRFEAWSHNEVASLLETVLRQLPAGALLVLHVGDREPFISRELSTAPAVGTARVAEHLLDGQQRLTALWRALHDNYPDRTYFVRLPQSDEERPSVLSQYRYHRNGVRYPMWCDDPAEVLSRGYVPLRLLNPQESKAGLAWCVEATGKDFERAIHLHERLGALASDVAYYNIPHLSLPVTTPPDVALDVFIKMNTSSVRLTAYDIVVAQLEEATGQSLHELVEALQAAVPAVHRYTDAGTLALDVAALRDDRPANQRSYTLLDFNRVAAEWDQIVEGIRWAIDFLEEEGVYDRDRLPSVVPLPVLAALALHLPGRPDERGNARTLLRAYLWRSFLTRRYDQAAATRAFQDFRALRSVLDGSGGERASAPVFDLEATPLPTREDVLGAGWPKGRETIARAILAISLREGARDFAEDLPAGARSLSEREYHHLFPDSLLTKVAGLSSASSYRALNCALITWRINRHISNKSPIDYLKDRADRADLGEESIRSRLATHLVPFDELATAGPYGEGDGEQLAADYRRFLEARADLVLARALALCDGHA